MENWQAKALQLLVALPILLFSVAWHESAHGLMALWQGDDTARKAGRISLNPFRHVDVFGSILLPALLILLGLPVLAAAKPTPVDPGKLKNPKAGFSLVALAGPVSNLFLALCFTFAGLLLVGIMNLPHVSLIVVQGIYLNLLLALFNILPLPTLDGLKVFYAVLPESWCWRLNRLEAYGFIFLYVGVLLLFNIPFLNRAFDGTLQTLLGLLLKIGHIL